MMRTLLLDFAACGQLQSVLDVWGFKPLMLSSLRLERGQRWELSPFHRYLAGMGCGDHPGPSCEGTLGFLLPIRTLKRASSPRSGPLAGAFSTLFPGWTK